MIVRTPAVMEADPPRCLAGHGDDAATDRAILHLRAAALALALTHAVAELRIIPVAATATDLALTAHIPGAHPGTGDEDTRAPAAARLPGKGITGGQGGPAPAPQATAEQEVLTLAGSGTGSPRHRSGDTTGTSRGLQSAPFGLVRKVNLMCCSYQFECR